jgi:hypothetical protein
MPEGHQKEEMIREVNMPLTADSRLFCFDNYLK